MASPSTAGATSIVGEVSYIGWPSIYGDQELPWRLRSLQKLEKL